MTDLVQAVGECLAPLPVKAPRRLAVPRSAWDCHFHIIGCPPQYPFSDLRSYTPPEASPQTLLSVLDAAGIDYGLAVQPAAHGTDNRRLRDALRAHPDRLKGIAVVNPGTDESWLSDLQQAGVVGIRLLDMPSGVGTGNLARLVPLCRELDWHIQICVRAERFAELFDELVALPVPFVMDHMGWFDPAAEETGQGFQAVLSLLKEANCWIKLSGPFRISREGPPYGDTLPFARKIVEQSPGRVVWGSDWPHVAITDPAKLPQYGDLLDLLAEVTTEPSLQRRILVDNPAALYGLPLRAPAATEASKAEETNP